MKEFEGLLPCESVKQISTSGGITILTTMDRVAFYNDGKWIELEIPLDHNEFDRYNKGC